MTKQRISEPWRLAVGAVALLAAIVSRAGAHDALADHIWHRVQLGVKAQHIEVTVELTFFKDESVRERQRMDDDGDGSLLRSEIDAYLNRIASEVKTQVALRVDGRPLALIPLHAPELDLHGRNTVERGHHRLTLRFFAALSENFGAGAELVVDDFLWPRAPSLGDVAPSHPGDALLEWRKVTGRSAPAAPREPLRFTARYLRPAPAELTRR